MGNSERIIGKIKSIIGSGLMYGQYRTYYIHAHG